MNLSRGDGSEHGRAAAYVAEAASGPVAPPSRQRLNRLRLDLLVRARGAAASDCVPLLLGDWIIGAVHTGLAIDIPQHFPAFDLTDGRLRLALDAGDTAACSAQMAAVARWLADQARSADSPWHGLARPWRNESLDVRASPDGPVLAQIDRSAVRALGILTQSVRLHARLPDGRVVLARRAARKRVDPGLWDNLAAGLIAAGESPRAALLRESAEEAGLDLSQPWAAASVDAATSRIVVDRSIPDGRLREVLRVYPVQLEPGLECRNHDGEVQGFAAFAPEAVADLIEAGAMSIEASLAAIDALSA